MLRVSANKTGSDIDINMIMGKVEKDSSDIPFAFELMEFAAGLASRDELELNKARDALCKAAGPAALVDAAGVAANFQRMVRIADSIGIPVDSNDNEISNQVRSDLDLYQFDKRSGS